VFVLGLALESSSFAGPFPGDGVEGPPLLYQDNGNGTITDLNTNLTREKKDNSGGVHDVANTYAWSSTGIAPDGPLFTDFLDKLNNRCAKNEDLVCTHDANCRAVGGKCGFAGKRDWRIPNVKELQSIVDYGTFNPAIDTSCWYWRDEPQNHLWSSTPSASNGSDAWFVDLNAGFVHTGNKKNNALRAFAVRGGW
jgi:uncharacterized protein DUF1566